MVLRVVVAGAGVPDCWDWSQPAHARKQMLGLLLLVGLKPVVVAAGAGRAVRARTWATRTPKSTYNVHTFGVDETGAAPGNGTTDPASVTVSVN